MVDFYVTDNFQGELIQAGVVVLHTAASKSEVLLSVI
jgi:hypothetical protein